MAANILAREFKISFADYFSIDISADVHVRRVFARLGLCTADATVEQVIYSVITEFCLKLNEIPLSFIESGIAERLTDKRRVENGYVKCPDY
jgi:hypothetical protein